MEQKTLFSGTNINSELEMLDAMMLSYGLMLSVVKCGLFIVVAR